jgi:RNase P/RNase MRP subunit p29
VRSNQFEVSHELGIRAHNYTHVGEAEPPTITVRAMIGAEVRVVEKREKHAEGRFGGLKRVTVVIRVRPVRQGQDRIWKQDRLVLLIADEVLILL